MSTTKPGIIETAKDKSIATIQGTGTFVEKTVDTAGNIISTTVKDTAKVGGTVLTAVTGLATDVIGGVEKVGVKTEHAAVAVAGGAFKAVGEVGSEAVQAVRTTVAKPTHPEPADAKAPAAKVSHN